MTEPEYKTDVEYLYSALLKHPFLLIDENKKKYFEQLYLSKRNKRYDYESLIDTATELTMFFHDGHTNIEIPYTSKDRCLPLNCSWDEKEKNQLILMQQYDPIPQRAGIIGIEGVAIEHVVNLISNRIPHENIFLVKSRMIRLPYSNYHIFSERNLKLLFGPKEEYTISFLIKGEKIEKKIPLSYYDGFLDFPDDQDFLSYEIQNQTMIMHFDSCILNEKYIETLKKLAYICKEKQITTFILDLSNNMGGNSAVIDQFIKFTKTDYYRRYEMIDFSSGEANCMVSRQDFVKNDPEALCLPDQIYCKVSYNTFSSARTFAVTLKDNGIAKIIGSQTGGKPNSYGMPKKMIMPISGIRFRVSRCLFLRPDAAMDDAMTLEPDLAV